MTRAASIKNSEVLVIAIGAVLFTMLLVGLIFLLVPTGGTDEGQPLRQGYSERLVPATVRLSSGRTVECVGIISDTGAGVSCDWEGVR